jgi:hypothetical protein
MVRIIGSNRYDTQQSQSFAEVFMGLAGMPGNPGLHSLGANLFCGRVENIWLRVQNQSTEKVTGSRDAKNESSGER